MAIEEDKLCKRYDDASGYTRSHIEGIRTSDAKKCEKCADEHRQLAEWLKDYKRLRESAISLDKIKQTREEIDDLTRHFDNNLYTDNTDPMFKCDEVLAILDKMISKSEGK